MQGKMEKLSQKKSENKSSKFGLFTLGLVSLKHYSQHRIHLQNPYFTQLELLVAAFSQWAFAPEKFALYEVWEHDQKFNLATQLLFQSISYFLQTCRVQKSRSGRPGAMSSTSAFSDHWGKLRLQDGGYRAICMVWTGGIPQKCFGFTTNGTAKKGKQIKRTGEKLLSPLTVYITLTKFFA